MAAMAMVANHVAFFGAKLDRVLAAAARTRPCESLRQSFILAATGGHCPLLGGSFLFTPPKFNIAPEKLPRSASNHHFSGSKMLNFGRVDPFSTLLEN